MGDGLGRSSGAEHLPVKRGGPGLRLGLGLGPGFIPQHCQNRASHVLIVETLNPSFYMWFYKNLWERTPVTPLECKTIIVTVIIWELIFYTDMYKDGYCIFFLNWL